MDYGYWSYLIIYSRIYEINVNWNGNGKEIIFWGLIGSIRSNSSSGGLRDWEDILEYVS